MAKKPVSAGEPTAINFSENYITEKPFYTVVGCEERLFLTAAHSETPDGRKDPLPVLFKGPTGCGKTRFIEYMAYQLKRPLITVPGHEDLSKADLVGRVTLEGMEGKWKDGPLTTAVKKGAIFYFDEMAEARADTTIVIHPLTDHRRELPIDTLGVVYKAHDNFMFAASYNPGYQSMRKGLKTSTKQRFVSFSMNYPSAEIEQEILQKETGIDPDQAKGLIEIAKKIRSLKTESGVLEEGCSTRLLVYAGRLLVTAKRTGIKLSPLEATTATLRDSVTDDRSTFQEIQQGLDELLKAYFG